MSEVLLLPVFGSEEFGTLAGHRDGDEGAHGLLQSFARQAGAVAVAAALTSSSVSAQARANDWANADEDFATASPYLFEDIGPPIPITIEPPRPWVEGVSGWNEEVPGHIPWEEDPPLVFLSVHEPPRPFLAFENEEIGQQPVGGGGGISRVPVSILLRFSGDELVSVPAPGGEEETAWLPPLVAPPVVVVPSPAPYGDELGTETFPPSEEMGAVARVVVPWPVVFAHRWMDEEIAAPPTTALEEDHWRTSIIVVPQNDSIVFLGDEARGVPEPGTIVEEQSWLPPVVQIQPPTWVSIRDEEYVPPIPVFDEDQVLRLYSVPAPIRLRDTSGDHEEWVPDFTPTMLDEPGPVLVVVPAPVVLPPAPFDEETVPFVSVMEEDRWTGGVVILPPVNAVVFSFTEDLTTTTVSEEDQPPVLFSVPAPVVLPVFVDEEWIPVGPAYEEDQWAPPLVVPTQVVIWTYPTEELATEGNIVLDEDLWAPPLVVLRPPFVPLPGVDDSEGLPIRPTGQPLIVTDRSRPFYEVDSRSRPFYRITHRSG